MSDLIRREDAIKALYKYSFVSKDIIEREINAIPSADRPQGEWMAKNSHTTYCSVCGFEEAAWRAQDYGYCPNCGAKMKGADDEKGY